MLVSKYQSKSFHCHSISSYKSSNKARRESKIACSWEGDRVKISSVYSRLRTGRWGVSLGVELVWHVHTLLVPFLVRRALVSLSLVFSSADSLLASYILCLLPYVGHHLHRLPDPPTWPGLPSLPLTCLHLPCVYCSASPFSLWDYFLSLSCSNLELKSRKIWECSHFQ